LRRNPALILVPEIDRDVNPARVMGLGELANVGTAAAVANAVYHATGNRVRRLCRSGSSLSCLPKAKWFLVVSEFRLSLFFEHVSSENRRPSSDQVRGQAFSGFMLQRG